MEASSTCCTRPPGTEREVLVVVMKSRMSSLVLEGIFCRPLAMEKGDVLRTETVVRVRASQWEKQYWEGSVRNIVLGAL